MYFRITGPAYASYRAAAEAVLGTGCDQIGLRIDSSHLEYLWWVLLKPSETGVRIEHLLVFPDLEPYQDPGFQPCAVLCTVCDERWQPPRGMRGQDMGDGIWVYLPW
jgi:hypothetical protein